VTTPLIGGLSIPDYRDFVAQVRWNGSQNGQGSRPLGTLCQRRFGRADLHPALEPTCNELTYVSDDIRVTYMEKTQVYLPKEELDALRAAAARSGRSVADLIREAIRKTVLKPSTEGPVAIWDGELRRTSMEHDSIYDDV